MMYELIPSDDPEHEKEPIESFLTNKMKNIQKEVPDITNIGVIPAYEPKTHEGQTIPPTQVKQQEKQMNPQKKYYRKHRQEILQKEKEKYNKEEAKQRKKDYYEKNKEKLKEKQKDRYKLKKEELNNIKSDVNIYTEDGGKTST